MAKPTVAPMGRPRDPELEVKVFHAARRIYNDLGWPKFTFRRIAEVSGVGKSALYRRWSSPEALLFAALQVDGGITTLGDDVTAKEGLHSFVTDIIAAYCGANGLVPLRIFIEARVYPEVFDRFRHEVIDPQLAYAHRLVRRGIDNGEISPNVDPVLLLDVLHGAVVSHALIAEQRRKDSPRRENDQFAQSLIDFVFAACSSPHRV